MKLKLLLGGLGGNRSAYFRIRSNFESRHGSSAPVLVLDLVLNPGPEILDYIVRLLSDNAAAAAVAKVSV